jgi:two-component system, OmpR family, response regulator RegX3
MTRILVVDDEPAIRESVAYAFEREGYDVVAVEDGETALSRARSEFFDAVILDVVLPGRSGTDVCRELRAVSSVPILMLTARTTELDRVVGLELGADDYVAKPFSVAELVARVRAILRRRELDRAPGGEVRRVGGLELDFRRHEVRVDGRTVELTPMEFRLLALFADEPERAFDRRELVRQLWESDHVGDERACDAHVVNLRRKIERDPAEPKRLVTVRGVGYKLVPV